ncbi:MAG: ribosome biogenesis GTP-binding protein YihA/YsxC [Acholeplasmatales bacterium]|nr:ribosome biogenesis GTP-binding protein YihA/YsxC [Acholeplasmatales bacterium]
MKTFDVSFVKSITDPQEQLLDHPSILIIGRSNVGKSTFINALANRLKLAKVSSTPGKTPYMNYYLVNNQLYLLDSPGYGWAKRSKTQIAEFKQMLDSFLHLTFKSVILLIDFKVGPTKDDKSFYQLLSDLHHDIIIICTKYDKVIPSLRIKQKKLLESQFNDSIIYYSSTLKTGLEEIKLRLFA